MTGAVIIAGENQGSKCNEVHRIQYCLASFVWMDAQWVEEKEHNFVYINLKKWLKVWKLSSSDSRRDACQGEQILHKRQWKRGRRLPAFAAAWPSPGSALLGCIRHPVLRGCSSQHMHTGRAVTRARRQRESQVYYISIITSIIVNYPPTGFQISNHRQIF